MSNSENEIAGYLRALDAACQAESAQEGKAIVTTLGVLALAERSAAEEGARSPFSNTHFKIPRS